MEEIIKYLGNFHPVILHLPIGAFLFTLLLFIYGKFSKIELTIPIRLGLVFSLYFSITSFRASISTEKFSLAFVFNGKIINEKKIKAINFFISIKCV